MKILRPAGKDVAGAAAAQVSQAFCGNVVCAGNPGVCKPGCVCCGYANGNSRCRPPKECTGGGVILSPVTTTTAAPTTTRPPTTTTLAPATTTLAPTTTTALTTTSTTLAPTTTITTGIPTSLPPCARRYSLCATSAVCCGGVCLANVDPAFPPTCAGDFVTCSASATCTGQASVQEDCVPDGTAPGLRYGGTSQCKRGRCEMLFDGTPVCCGFVGPSAEVCDGTVDQGAAGVGQSCGTDVGPCTLGFTACVSGSLICLGGVKPLPEICDGIDNDCDGEIDIGALCPPNETCPGAAGCVADE